MFRKSSSQVPLLESSIFLTKLQRERLQKSWAHAFRERVLPLIDEEVFRDAFCQDNGRPNRSIRLLVGVHLLKEAEDLTDEQALDALRFNVKWQYALAVGPAEADLCQKTMHNFRVRLLASERAPKLFEKVTVALARVDGLSVRVQRLDSTHILSNVAVLTRLGLLTETITAFLRELRRVVPAEYEALPPACRERYVEDTGFSDATREQARRRIGAVAEDLGRLVAQFRGHPTVSALRAYGVMERVLAEQCAELPAQEVGAGAQKGGSSGGESGGSSGGESGGSSGGESGGSSGGESGGSSGGETGDEPGEGGSAPADGRPTVFAPKPAAEVPSNSVQSPHDPGVTYGHKGKGYEVQLAETCVPENPYQIVTHLDVTDACGSDQNATIPVIEALVSRKLTPDELVADTGYGSGENIVSAAELGIALVAPVQDPKAASARSEEPAWAPTAPGGPERASDGRAAVGAEPPLTGQSEDPGLTLADFRFTSTFARVQACPNGVAPEHIDFGDECHRAWFPADRCGTCPMASRCPTRSAKDGRRSLLWRDTAAATRHRQEEQATEEFRRRTCIRSGIEATNSTLKRRYGLRKLRVRTRARVEASVCLKVLSLNAMRACAHHARVAATSSQPAPKASATAR